MLMAVRRRTKRFIPVYRLAIDAMTRKGDDVTGRKWPSLLEDFQTGRSINGSQETSASYARGLLCFCLTPSIRKPIRSIRLIRVSPIVQALGFFALQSLSL